LNGICGIYLDSDNNGLCKTICSRIDETICKKEGDDGRSGDCFWLEKDESDSSSSGKCINKVFL
jgi:hypothetical protein